MHFQVDDRQSDRTTIWIDVPDRSVNAFNQEVFDALDEVLVALINAASDRSRMVPLVFRSAKKKGFVVGADLKKILAIQSDKETQDFLERGQQLFSKLERWPSPTVAVVQGACLGGGLEFALACKFRIAVDLPEAKLGMPESKLGLMPGWGGTQRLIEQVGLQVGLDMLLHGEPVSGEQALRIGLVDELVSLENLEPNLTLFLSKIPSKGTRKNKPSMEEYAEVFPKTNERLTDAQSAILKAVEAGLRMEREQGFRVERESFYVLLSSPGVRANIEKIVAPKQ